MGFPPGPSPPEVKAADLPGPLGLEGTGQEPHAYQERGAVGVGVPPAPLGKEWLREGDTPGF